MATQEDLINRRTRNVSPHPGDGICPTITQHHGTATASYETWAKLVSEAKESTVSFHTADGLIKLLQQIPELYPHNSKAFFIHYGSIPHLKYALEWVTTTDPTCERPIRRTYHYLTLGIRQPLACEFSNMSENIPLWAGLQADQMKHLSRLILTWAYILSARWVEILNAAGEKAFMEERKDINGEYFWEMIIERQWQATLVRGDKISYSPWCMEQNTVASSVETAKRSTGALYAFQTLQTFCRSEAVTKECASIALAVVLTIPELGAGPIKLPPVAAPEEIHHPSGVEEEYCKPLFECLNRCITLSCCQEGITSLLCSVFFEPRIPCNLIGSHMLGVKKAIEPVRSKPKDFARLMVRQNARISSLWLAAIWTGRASSILNSALGGMPPISLPMASWTGVPQSFIQVGYHSISNRDGFIPRAQEFGTIYLVHPDTRIPFTPSPPFGETAISGTSLDTRRHLLHDHKPMRLTTYWILETEEFHLAQMQPQMTDRPVLRLPPIARASTDDGVNANVIEDDANRSSSDATGNLFSWYRNLEGGLWLEENRGKHAWIIYGAEEHDLPVDEESKPPLDDSRIRAWQESTALDVTWATSAEDISLRPATPELI